MKPIIVLDFDGVIHSYASGWKGASNIPDDPVDGAIPFLLSSLAAYSVNILSSRSHQWGGRRAMKKWLKKHLVEFAHKASYEGRKILFFEPGMDLWEDELEWWANKIIKMIKWPIFKPPALITIDDRAITFTGKWPSNDEIKNFVPWNKKQV